MSFWDDGAIQLWIDESFLVLWLAACSPRHSIRAESKHEAVARLRIVVA